MPTSPPGAPSADHRAEFGRLKKGMHVRWTIFMFGWVVLGGAFLAHVRGPVAYAAGVIVFLAVAWVVDLRIWRDYRCPGCRVKFDRLDRKPSPRNCRKCGALLGD